MVWKLLIGNLASVALLISLWMHVHYKFYRMSRSQADLGFGAMMGVGAVLSMALSVELEPGYYFDLRTTLLAISAIFGGPLALAVTAPMALAYRLFMGGAGVTAGVMSICLVSLLALGARFLLGRKAMGNYGVLAAGVTVAFVSFAMSLLFPHRPTDMTILGVPVAVLRFFGTIIVGSCITYFHRFTLERDILHAALTQAPDFHYVKNLKSEFVVTNLNVVRQNGRQRSSEMVGLTDFDLVPPDRAQELYEMEQRIIRSGEPVVDHEECLPDKAGKARWYLTSKVPLRNRQGETVGLAGVTRDITARKRLERELVESRNLLSQAMEEMSDGLAMFNSDGVLVFCNEQYRAAFPLSAYARRPGSHIADILRAVARTGERVDLPADVSDEWIGKEAKELFRSRDTEVSLSDGRWLSLRTRLGQDGSSLVVVSDITAMKQAELSLKQLARQMKGLAETDPLTGLRNRRVFDEAIAMECTRSAGGGVPLGLLLIDIDRFKAYNDTYGHLEGDKCLKAVAEALRTAFRRPGDVIARYGGEEFAVLLPGTELAAAAMLADEAVKALRAAKIVHAASEHHIVTASVGIAVTGGECPVLTPAELIARADEALYRAKRNGRNRAEAWASEVVPAQKSAQN